MLLDSTDKKVSGLDKPRRMSFLAAAAFFFVSRGVCLALAVSLLLAAVVSPRWFLALLDEQGER